MRFPALNMTILVVARSASQSDVAISATATNMLVVGKMYRRITLRLPRRGPPATAILGLAVTNVHPLRRPSPGHLHCPENNPPGLPSRSAPDFVAASAAPPSRGLRAPRRPLPPSWTFSWPDGGRPGHGHCSEKPLTLPVRDGGLCGPDSIGALQQRLRVAQAQRRLTSLLSSVRASA